MIMMSNLSHPHQLKRTHPDHPLTVSTLNTSSKKLKYLKDYVEEDHQPFFHQRCKNSSCDWSINHRKKLKRTSEKKVSCAEEDEQQYHSQVYLKFYPKTRKCSIDVIVKSIDNPNNDHFDDPDALLIGKTRIPIFIKPGLIRLRLVSSLFTADGDVHEDPSLTKIETIRHQSNLNHFEKQFALLFKNDRIGPGVIGKLFIESMDSLNGSYSNNIPLFELNLHLASEHEILLTSSDQKINNHSICAPLSCGCVLSSDPSTMNISDRCNLKLNNMKLIHRLSEPLRCQWKSIGRELNSCFNESDLTDLYQSYFLTDGNHECTYQLLREWSIRDPEQANIRYLFTRLKLPLELIVTLHNDVVVAFLS